MVREYEKGWVEKWKRRVRVNGNMKDMFDYALSLLNQPENMVPSNVSGKRVNVESVVVNICPPILRSIVDSKWFELAMRFFSS